MKFFAKKGVAILLTVLMVAASILIAVGAAPEKASAAGNTAQSSSWVADQAGLLSQAAVRRRNKTNEKLNEAYGGVLAFVAQESLNGADIEDYAFEMGDTLGLGTCDLILVIETSSTDWYVAAGEQAQLYLTDELEALFSECVDGLQTASDSAGWMDTLCDGLEDWYKASFPKLSSTAAAAPADTQSVYSYAPRRVSLWKVLLALLILY